MTPHFGLLEPTGRSSHVLRAATFPAKGLIGYADLGPHRDPITYQWEGNCASNAVPLSCAQTLRAKGHALPWTPSIRETYAAVLARIRAAMYPKLDVRELMRLHPLTDTGSELLDVVDAVQAVGLCAMGRLVGGQFTDDGPTPSEPTHGAVREQLHNVMVGCKQLTSTNEVQAALESGVVCPVGGWVNDVGFCDWTPDKPPVGAQNRLASGGGHAVRAEAVGHVDANGYVREWVTSDGIDWSTVRIKADPGTRVWRLVNSWGRDWGLGGCVVVTDEFMADRWELYATDVEVRA